jgi:hypothetical protein
MSLSLAPTLLLRPCNRNGDRNGDLKDELSPRGEFRTAIERLKGNVPRESQELHQALQLLSASTITTHAGIIYRHLADYHIKKSEESRGPLISTFARHTGVSETTIQSQMRSKGLLVSIILETLHLDKRTIVSDERTPWAVVIVLLMLVQPKIKTKSNNQDISEFLKDILLDYKDEDWQQPSFLTDSVLDVIQTASGFRLEPRSRGRQSRIILPSKGGLLKLKLVRSRSQEDLGHKM